MPLRNPNVSLIYHGMHFTEADCDAITASAIDSAWQEGGVGGRGDVSGVVGQSRSCLEQHLPVNHQTGTPLNRISQEVSTCPKHAYTGRAIELVARKNVKIAI